MVVPRRCGIRDAIEVPARYGGGMTDEPATLPTAVEPPPPPHEEPRKSAVPGAAPGGARRTGVVFVHGIGTQVARETLFDWARPIIDVLGEWRREYDRKKNSASWPQRKDQSASKGQQ